MTKKLCAIAVVVGALTWATPAMAGVGSGGAGAAQIGAQIADTQQGAVATATSKQNAVNANVPVSIAGGNVTAGPSSATQNADSDARANASNDAETNQTQTQTQNVDNGSSCSVGCGGAGAAQIGAQVAKTDQSADATAVSDQNAVNANVPVSIAGGDVSSGPSSADQTANSDANAKAKNDADTNQTQTQTQNVGNGSSCVAGCGGAGAAQIGAQVAKTDQGADATATSDQNAVNANVPVSIAGGNVTAGPSSANQTANSDANAKAKNDADTSQTQNQNQNVGGSSSCKVGCGGAGAFQAGVQLADTHQWADATAVSDQNAVNANVPVAIAGGDIYAGPSSADQNVSSKAKANASNDADTTQNQTQNQTVGGGSSCLAGCGGAGAAQIGLQLASTHQWADATATSDQNAVNSNAPVSVAGGDIYAGPSSATQNADSNAKAKAKNDADTNQSQTQTQDVGGRRSSCKLGCGGPCAFQLGIQKADTKQWADATAVSLQNAVNGNAPHSVAGGDIYAGPSSATQYADSNADAKAKNDADTYQAACQDQKLGW
jgi:hypothetical protein